MPFSFFFALLKKSMFPESWHFSNFKTGLKCRFKGFREGLRHLENGNGKRGHNGGAARLWGTVRRGGERVSEGRPEPGTCLTIQRRRGCPVSGIFTAPGGGGSGCPTSGDLGATLRITCPSPSASFVLEVPSRWQPSTRGKSPCRGYSWPKQSPDRGGQEDGDTECPARR